MDDFTVTNLNESKNEWSARLVNLLTPLIMQGFRSIFNESTRMCEENDEHEKYLMTFQNLLANIPNWNATTIEEERNRIIETSGCGYLGDLITCVHVIQLKLLTCVRVGQSQKKIDINIPSLDSFIHKAYIQVARKLYTNVYIFEKDLMPLQIQQCNREFETIVKECILNAVRESIPIEEILRAYLDETTEDEVVKEVKEEIIEEPVKEPEKEPEAAPPSSVKTDSVKETPAPIVDTSNIVATEPLSESIDAASAPVSAPPPPPPAAVPENKTLSFNDTDMAVNVEGAVESIEAPKTVDRLEQISSDRNEQRKIEEGEDDEEDKLVISNDPISLDVMDVHDIPAPDIKVDDSSLLTDIEILT